MEHDNVEENASEQLTKGETEASPAENEDDEETLPPYFMDVF